MAESLKRYPPLLMHSLLDATRRFEPMLYARICRQHNLDADRILGLFGAVEEIGAGQLSWMLAELRAHTAYHEIVFLAGRNALVGWCEANRVSLGKKPLLAGADERFGTLTRKLLPDFLGRGSCSQMARGSLSYVEVHGSPFAEGVQHINPVCGFYAGFLSELGTGCTGRGCPVSEVRCVVSDPSTASCLFQVPL